jgi:DNA-cytosine methyltransferase
MNILSLFDGMSCGQIAINKLGIPYDRYVSSEIDAHSIKITQKNYPKTEQIGGVEHIITDQLLGIDVLLGGSPCQDLSNVNVYTNQKGINGEKSKLFWEFVRILNDTNPQWFLFENVGSASKEDVKVIDSELGVSGIPFNSKNVSMQYRNRTYWTNIPFDWMCQSKQPSIKTILEKDVDSKYYVTEKMRDYIMSMGTGGWQSGKLEIDLDTARPLTATMHKMHRADTDNYVTGIAPIGKTNIRRLTPIECERLMGVPDNYTYGVSDTQRYRMLGNGWQVDTICHILKGITN